MIIQRISKDGKPILTSNIFTGTFNVPTPGVYDFGSVAAPVAGNTDQVCINIESKYYYLIDKVSISASIPEGVFLESYNTLPQLTFKYAFTPYNIYPFPLPAINYIDGLDWSFFFHSNKETDQLLISLTGVLNQVAATVGVADIKILASFVIYREENIKALETLRATKNKSVVCFNE